MAGRKVFFGCLAVLVIFFPSQYFTRQSWTNRNSLEFRNLQRAPLYPDQREKFFFLTAATRRFFCFFDPLPWHRHRHVEFLWQRHCVASCIVRVLCIWSWSFGRIDSITTRQPIDPRQFSWFLADTAGPGWKWSHVVEGSGWWRNFVCQVQFCVVSRQTNWNYLVVAVLEVGSYAVSNVMGGVCSWSRTLISRKSWQSMLKICLENRKGVMKMTEFSSALCLYVPQTRFVVKYRHVDSQLVLKITNDVVVRFSHQSQFSSFSARVKIARKISLLLHDDNQPVSENLHLLSRRSAIFWSSIACLLWTIFTCACKFTSGEASCRSPVYYSTSDEVHVSPISKTRRWLGHLPCGSCFQV